MNPSQKEYLRILIGQTAIGKNEVACYIANRINAEIISVDSMKIYRGMDIGTSKSSLEQRRKVKYHLIDIVESYEEYNVAKFVNDCDKAIADIIKRGKKPLLVCGTPLYLKALLYGIFSGLSSSPELRVELEKTASEKGLDFLYEQLRKIDPVRVSGTDRIHPNDKKRIIRAIEVYTISGKPISSFQTHFNKNELRYQATVVGLKRTSDDLYSRIDARVEKMFRQGLVDEVKRLVDSPHGLSKQAAQAVGYKEVIKYLKGEITLEEAKDEVEKNTRHLAKRQMTWFRRFTEINWIECPPDATTNQICDKIIKTFSIKDS
ncbi:MAG: tRNA (adenosine(37)-N6)-dimethylallyltransferase MiaA [Planctomycetota bacterium]